MKKVLIVFFMLVILFLTCFTVSGNNISKSEVKSEDITMANNGRIYGYVKSYTGDPVEGVKVTAFTTPVQPKNDTTDSTGYYSIGGLKLQYYAVQTDRSVLVNHVHLSEDEPEKRSDFTVRSKDKSMTIALYKIINNPLLKILFGKISFPYLK